MGHKTPLKYHFKDKHIWFDMAMLGLLFVIASYIPLLKIVPLVASLELFSFFSFHLLTERRRFHLQGFLGGFISSTAVFIQMLNDSKFKTIGDHNLILTLLFALCAMLLECVLIIYYLSESISFIYYLPFLVQLLFFSIAIIFISFRSRSQVASHKASLSSLENELMFDHPILWKNVAKLSLFILVLITVMHYLGNEAGFSRGISTFVVSFFEAHAILASVMTEWSLQPDDIELMQLLILILLGNALSKSYLAIKGHNLVKKRFFLSLMFVSMASSAGITYLWSYLM